MEIQKNSPVPIYMQIVYDIKNKINFGKLKGGDQLPSVRSLSHEFDINVNTVLKAYDQLIKEGYVTSQKGLGYYVSSNIKENVVAYQMEYIRQSLELIKKSAEIGDISLETICNLMKEVWNDEEMEQVNENSSEDTTELKLEKYTFDILERRSLMMPSGFELYSGSGKGHNFFFKLDIVSVIQQTDDKIVLIDYNGEYKSFIESLGGKYVDLSNEECNYTNLLKFEKARMLDQKGDGYVLTPLSERITCFNLDYSQKENIDIIIKTAFCKAELTTWLDTKPNHIWLYIPSINVMHYHYQAVYDAAKSSRINGIIYTIAIDTKDISAEKDVIRAMLMNSRYNVLIDDIAKYNSQLDKDLSNYIDVYNLYSLDYKEYIEENESYSFYTL